MKSIGRYISLSVPLLVLTACVASTARQVPTTLPIMPSPSFIPTHDTTPTATSTLMPSPLVPSLVPAEQLQIEGTIAWQLPNAEIWQVAYSPNSDHLAVVSSLGVLIYETSTLEPRAVIPKESDIHTVAWSPNGRLLASASKDGRVGIWDWDTGKELTIIADSSYWVSTVAWSADGKQLVGAMGEGVQVWNVYAKENRIVFSLKAMRSVAWSPDGSQLAIGDLNVTVSVWNTATWKKLAGLRGTGRHESESFWTVAVLSWSPDGQQLAGGLEDGTILVWDQTTGDVVSTFLGHMQEMHCLAWSPDGKQLASADYDWIGRVWDVSTGKELITLDELGKIASITWSPDRKYLTIGTMEGLLIIWDVRQLPL